MIDAAPPVEHVYKISPEEEKSMLVDHFDLLYILLSESKIVPNATFEIVNGLKRGLSGIPFPYHNAVLGVPEKKNYEKCIKDQIQFFKKENVPFVWYVDEDSEEEFKKKLLDYGFTNVGVFRGVLGELDKSLIKPVALDGVVLELVKDESVMGEFSDLVGEVFGTDAKNRELYKKAMWEAAKIPNGKAYHWVARKDGRVVSALTTVIDGDVVSFWNGATHPDFRCQGLSTSLRKFALQDAITNGCHCGASYLMSEALALGICKKLGYQTKWRFYAFLSPKETLLD